MNQTACAGQVEFSRAPTVVVRYLKTDTISRMTAALLILTSLLALGFALALLALFRVRRKELGILTREAMLDARKQLALESDALADAKLRQAYEEGVLEGLKRADRETKLDADSVFRQGVERGLLEGEINAEKNFHIEYWTEVKKNQGYFFTSAEVVACYQLMYKNIPLGSPQRHTIETSETVDRAALNQMADRILGQSALAPAASNLQGIRVISREVPADTVRLPGKASR